MRNSRELDVATGQRIAMPKDVTGAESPLDTERRETTMTKAIDALAFILIMVLAAASVGLVLGMQVGALVLGVKLSPFMSYVAWGAEFGTQLCGERVLSYV